MSIRARLLLAATAVLLGFIVLCGAGLESAFRESARASEENRLRAIVFALLGAAEQDATTHNLVINDADLPEQRLRQPDSGLEAAVLDESGKLLWGSPSMTDPPPVVIGPDVGKWKFERLDESGDFALTFGLRWVDPQDTHRFTLLVLEDPDAYETQVGTFRRTVRLWLSGAAAGVLIALLLVQRWGLAPLARLVRELKGVESGTQGRIEGRYPQELTPLTSALNTMIVSERSQLQRYRNALGDLAHSLKTPLAVLRNLAADPQWPAEPRRQLDEQLGHMQLITQHQLGRAALAGRRALAQPVALKTVAAKVTTALGKVYADKGLAFELDFAPDLLVRADSGDLYELLGNTLDNAAKWSRSRVRLRASRSGTTVRLDVEDNGPGFPAEPAKLLQRGARADTRVPGQGLGLAAVTDILEAYEGTIALERSSDLGGALVAISIPNA